MTDFNPPTPTPPTNNKSVSPKQLGAAMFLFAVIALLIGILIASSDDSSTSTTTTTTTQAPVITSAPVNKYDSYLEHVYNNSGQANSLTKAKLIEYGDIICHSLDNGRTIPWIVEYLSNASTSDSDLELYASIVYGSITYICPEYKYALGEYLATN